MSYYIVFSYFLRYNVAFVIIIAQRLSLVLGNDENHGTFRITSPNNKVVFPKAFISNFS